jgi:polyhydroxyalkanoate synthesis regulator phasin
MQRHEIMIDDLEVRTVSQVDRVDRLEAQVRDRENRLQRQ